MEFTSTVHPISWFRDRYLDGTLEIKPPFQRKPVWAARQKCYLVESVLLELPVPEVYVQQTTTPEGRTTYGIVDGQQRIRTVLQFIGSEMDPDQEEYNKFALDKLPTSSRWRNLTFADLQDPTKISFFDYRFSVRYLKTEDDGEIKDMFRRLNKFLTPLKPQELRNATYSGPFVSLVEELADDEYWVENRIVSPALIRRMNDVEFVSELLIGVLHGPQGGSSAVIDSYYEIYEDYEDEFPGERQAVRLFERTLDCVKVVLPDIQKSRWGNKTDFYTLFIGCASLLREGNFVRGRRTALRQTLLRLAEEVNKRLADETADVSGEAVEYVRAVEKGANDKRRRANRHLVLTRLMGQFFRNGK